MNKINQTEIHTTLTLPVPPSANIYWRVNRRTGSIYVSPEGKAYKTEAGWLARAAGIEPITDGEIAVSLTWFRKYKRGDTDNRFKVMFDALNKIAWRDDSQIAEMHVFRRMDRLCEPRMEIEVWALE